MDLLLLEVFYFNGALTQCGVPVGDQQTKKAEFAPSLDQRISSEASAITMAERFAMSR